MANIIVLVVRDNSVPTNTNGQFVRACTSRAVAMTVLTKYCRNNWGARGLSAPAPKKASELIAAYFPAGDLGDISIAGTGPSFAMAAVPTVDEARAAAMPPKTSATGAKPLGSAKTNGSARRTMPARKTAGRSAAATAGSGSSN